MKMGEMVEFWGEYADLVRASSVPEPQVQRFVRWAERYSREMIPSGVTRLMAMLIKPARETRTMMNVIISYFQQLH